MNQKTSRTMLIVIEGLDGSGKSTQVKKLKTHLEKLYGSVNYIHFPRYGAPVYGDLISRFLKGEFGLPRPDLNIFLDVPIGFVEKKLSSHRNGNDRDYLEGGQDIHEADINFQKAVRKMYLEQCAIDPDFIRIDCSGPEGEMLPPDEIFRRITVAMGGR